MQELLSLCTWYYDVRTFIAHDYDGVNLALIEKIIIDRLHIMKEVTYKVLL